MSLSFVQTELFSELWTNRYGLNDDELTELEGLLSRNVLAGRVIRGGGGIRKLRFSPSGSGRRKSGGFRVVYSVVGGRLVLVLLME